MKGPRGEGTWIFLFLSCVYLVTSGGHLYTGDGIEMCQTAESLVLRGDLAVMPGVEGRVWGYPGRDGRRYSPYALGLSLVEAPFLVAGHAAASMLQLHDRARMALVHAAVVSANAFLTAATGALLFSLVRTLGCRRRAAAATALLYGLGTMAWVYSKHDFAEPLAALCLLGAVLFLVRAGEKGLPGSLAIAGAFNGYAFFTKYAMVIYTPILLAWIYASTRRADRRVPPILARFAWFLAPGLLFGLANLYVNHARFGTWLRTGYGNQGEIFAGWGFLPVGLFGLLLSPGKGIFWFSPLLLAVPFAWREFHRRHPRMSLLSAALAGATVLMVAPLWWWHGDWAWGPRYMVVALPYLTLPLAAWFQDPLRLSARIAGPVRLRHALAGLLLAALAVNALGLSVNFVYYLQALRGWEKVHDDWNFVPNLSPIRFHAHVVRANLLRSLGGEAPDFQYRAWCDGVFQERRISLASFAEAGQEPDYFFFRPRATRTDQAALFGAGMILIAGAAVCARRVRDALGPGP